MTGFFDGLEIINPGLAAVMARPGQPSADAAYAGLGRQFH